MVSYHAASLLNHDDTLAKVLLQADGGIRATGTAADDGNIASDDLREPAGGADGRGSGQETAGQTESGRHEDDG